VEHTRYNLFIQISFLQGLAAAILLVLLTVKTAIMFDRREDPTLVSLCETMTLACSCQYITLEARTGECLDLEDPLRAKWPSLPTRNKLQVQFTLSGDVR